MPLVPDYIRISPLQVQSCIISVVFKLREHRNNAGLSLPKPALMSLLLLQPTEVAIRHVLSDLSAAELKPGQVRTAWFRVPQTPKPSLYELGVSK